MAISRRTILSILTAAALTASLAACSGNSTAGSGSGSGSKAGGGSSSVSTATFSGSESGTVVMNLCTDSGADSVFVTVKGSSDKLPGVVSKTSMDFDGTDSIYTIDKTGPLPQFSTDGNTVTLDGVELKSVIDPTKVVTFAGKITCP
jgi:hypothetical protein